MISYTNSKLSEYPAFSDTITVNIAKNSNVDQIVAEFNQYDLLSPDWLFSNYIKILMKKDVRGVYAGNYDITPTTSNDKIIDMILTGGYANTTSISIPEGLNNKEIANIFESKLGIDKLQFLSLTKSDSLLSKWNIKANNALGYLLPETYDFYGDETANQIIDKLLKHHQDIWTTENEEKLKNSGLSKLELLTIASIVQAETPLESELETVAGLYLNRVKIGMMLQADPTVQFALGDKKRLLYKDLEYDSPYNTYKYAGIPPGPINNPGKAAILATLNPEKHNYLYMVAFGDGSGSHYFAKTVREHNNNVIKYKKARGRQ
jgi:UPF0755 protein